MDPEHRRAVRQIRQRLEALSRAGLDRIPIAELLHQHPRLTIKDGKAVPESSLEQDIGHEVEPLATEPPPRTRSDPEPPPAPTPKPVTRSNPPASTHGLESITGNTASLFDDEDTITTPEIPAADRSEALRVLAATIGNCTKCEVLASQRTNTVPGEGAPNARLMFIGEGPGETEDQTGRPFVGRAGSLLTDMITKGMGLTREEVYIANIVKCRPPGNRDPEPEEVNNCIGYLEQQIEIIRPEFLCLLGRPATQSILNTSQSMSKLRGRWHRYKGIPTIPTWHPAYLLRNPSAKKDAWKDLQMLMQAMGITPPKRGNSSGS